LLAFLLLPVFYGIKFLFLTKTQEQKEVGTELVFGDAKSCWIIALGLFAGLTIQGVTYFFYNLSVALSFLNFFLLATLVVVISSKKKEYDFKASSLLATIITFAFTLVFIFGLSVIILGGQRYVADANYYKSLLSIQLDDKDNARKNLEIAASLNSSSDLYFRQLSRVYIALLQDKFKKLVQILLMLTKMKLKY